MYLFDQLTTRFVEAEIVEGLSKDMPLKKDGWHFAWRSIQKKKDTTTYVLRLKSDPSSIQGVMQLKVEDGMMIMELLEIAPSNIGQEEKRYDYVAGCLIAFACRESFKIDGNYKGFLVFESKTRLIRWYMEKYFAQVAIGQKMFIEPLDGERLMKIYLEGNRK